MRAALLLLALSGCATVPRPQQCNLTQPCQCDPIPAVVTPTLAPAPHRVGAEIGGYPTASTLLGPERMIADQNGATVNITPSQISTFVFANGGTAGLNQLLPSQTGQNGNCLSTNGTNPLWAACGSGGGSTWPTSAGIACYSGASSWCTSYNPSNQIPASYIPTLNQNTTGLAGGISGSPMTGQFWGYNGSAQGWYTPTGSGTVNSGTSGQLAYYAATGTAVSGATTSAGALAALSASTAITVAGSAGCSPTISGTAGPFGGLVNIVSGCTGGSATITVTIDGGGLSSSAHGYSCSMGDHNQPFLPALKETSSTSTTATFSIPAAYATSDVATVDCSGFY